MRNLSEEIINKYLTGQCSEEELMEVNAWISESDENARQLFRMEEIYHLGKFDHYADEQRMANAEKSIIRKSKFPQNPKRSVRFSGKRTKRSVQKRKARNTQKAETKVL